MKSDWRAVTVVTGVTAYRGGYPLKNIDDCTFKDKLSVLNFLKNPGKNTNCSILEWCDQENEGTYTLPNIVTSVTSVTKIGNYTVIPAYPATGIVYIINNFLSGHVRLRGTGGGAYPANYLKMIDSLFGPEPNTIEVCSGRVSNCFTVDINQEKNPSLCTDGQSLHGIADNTFSRWRCDPPYNEKTAKEMYNCELPSLPKLLTAGARVVKTGSLMFLLLGPQNYQRCPAGVKRIGWVAITVVPNNELRALHIFYKLDDEFS